MTPEQFRRYGRDVVDWIADYYERLESYPVLSTVRPGDIRASLPDAPPEHGEPFEAVLRDLDAVLMPGITHWQHPSFFAYFPANSSGPAVLADLLASGTFRMQALFDRVPTRFLAEDQLPNLDSLRNINTPEEYAAAYNSLSSKD